MKIISNEILQLYVKMKNIQFSVNPGGEKKKHSKEIEKPILPIVRDLYKKGTSKL